MSCVDGEALVVDGTTNAEQPRATTGGTLRSLVLFADLDDRDLPDRGEAAPRDTVGAA